MLEYLESRPIARFFAEVLAMVLGAVALVMGAGWALGWTSRTNYSDGFFIACVALAAIASSRAVMYRPTYAKRPESPPRHTLDPNLSALAVFFARRSFNFRMLMAAVVCLVISVLIAQ